VSRFECEFLENISCFETNKQNLLSREIVVISLFDGISCGLQALKNLGFSNIKYFASEIEPNAIKISEKNHPDIIRLGDVRTVKISGNYIESENGKWRLGDENYYQKVDLILAGSPCQGFSFAGSELNFNDPRSALFFEFVRIKKEIEDYQGSVDFLLENVKMRAEFEDVITHHLKTWPVKINSRAFTAQNRERYYWSSFLQTTTYGEKDIKDLEHSPKIVDILEDKDYKGVWTWPRGYNKGGTRLVDKMPCITTSSWQHNFLVEKENGERRKFTPIECERAQGFGFIKKEVEIFTCLDQAKNFVSVVKKNPKLLKLVLNVEETELQEFVKAVGYNTHQKFLLTKYTAPESVGMGIPLQTKPRNQQIEQFLSADSAEQKQPCLFQRTGEVSVVQGVSICIIEGKIAQIGRGELPQKDSLFTQQTLGKMQLNLFGNETMLHVNDAESILNMMMDSSSTFTTLSRLSMKSTDQILRICYWFAESVITGYIPMQTGKACLSLSLYDGYTAGISDNQRYRVLGNGWTVPVIEKILSALCGD
jgi:site-specific DNA-cytosine methylase